MRTSLLAVLLLASSASSAERIFGRKPALSRPVPLAEAMAAPGQAGEILLEGRVVKVCQKKGCWLLLSDGEAEVRITFKDYAFFVPKDSAARKVRAQGVLKREELSVKAARHFLKDEGASAVDIAKVKAPVKSWSFVASGLEFVD